MVSQKQLKSLKLWQGLAEDLSKDIVERLKQGEQVEAGPLKLTRQGAVARRFWSFFVRKHAQVSEIPSLRKAA
jgi:hypothetical protein